MVSSGSSIANVQKYSYHLNGKHKEWFKAVRDKCDIMHLLMVGNQRKALLPRRCSARQSQARGTRWGRWRSRWSCSARQRCCPPVCSHRTCFIGWWWPSPWWWIRTCKLFHRYTCCRWTRTSPSAPQCRCTQKARLSCLAIVVDGDDEDDDWRKWWWRWWCKWPAAISCSLERGFLM